MTAELLREAAALMRSRAEVASPAPWAVGYCNEVLDGGGRHDVVPASEFECEQPARCYDAEHIASWHPAVALVVADWLDAQATLAEPMPGFDIEGMGDASGLAVARAYLGRDA